MKFKKFWALLLALCLAVGMLPVSVFAAGETSGDWENIHWEYDAASATLTITGEGDMPDTARREQPYFNVAKDAKKVVIGEGITSISKYAFSHFNLMKELTILGPVTKIDDYAFEVCISLTSFSIPKTVEELGQDVFSNCERLESVTIPDGVKAIGSYAFYGCDALMEIHIPASVTQIGKAPYTDEYGRTHAGSSILPGTTSLERITVDSRNPNFTSENSFLLNKEKTEVLDVASAAPGANFVVPDSVRKIWIAFGWLPSCKLTIPEGVCELTINNEGVTSSAIELFVKNPYMDLSIYDNNPSYSKTRTYVIHSYSGSSIEKYAESKEYRFEPFEESLDAFKSKYQVVDKEGDAFFRKDGQSFVSRQPLASFTIDTDATELLGVVINGELISDGVTEDRWYHDYSKYIVSHENGKMVVSFTWYLLLNSYREGNEIVFLLPDGAASVPFDMVNLSDDYQLQNNNYRNWVEWHYGSKSDLTFETDAAGDSLKAVYIDSTRLSSTDYTVSEDQCTISIHPNYLQALPYGMHALIVMYENGELPCFVNISYEGQAEILDGALTYWHHDSGKDVTIRIDAPKEKFQGLYTGSFQYYEEFVDEAGFLKSDYYRVESGPDQTTVITISSDFLSRYLEDDPDFSAFHGQGIEAVFSDCETQQFLIRYALYGMTEGESVVWNESQDGDLTLHVDGFDKDKYQVLTDLYPVLLNNRLYTFPEGYTFYTFEQDGTVITFHKECLSRLPAGKYEVEFRFCEERHGNVTSGGGVIHVTLYIVKPTGDLNGDGEMDTRDATRLVQHLSNWDAELAGSADFNNDGEVDTRDATRLIQYLSGWEVELY